MEKEKMWMACRIWKRISMHPSVEYRIQIWETIIHGVNEGFVRITVCGDNESGWVANAFRHEGLETVEIQQSTVCSHITHTLQGPIWEKILKSGVVE